MFFVILLQALTACLVSYLSKNCGPYDLFETKDYGRITYHRPPPPPQIYFPTSADYADEYYLRSLTNVTLMMSARGFSNATDSTANTGTPFFRVSLPQRFNRVFHRLVPVASWILSTAAEIILAAHQFLAAFALPATAAWALNERKNRDRESLNEKRVSPLLLPFWMLARMDEKKDKAISALEEMLQSQRRDREAFVCTIEDLREQQYTSTVINSSLRSMVERHYEKIKYREEDLDAQQEDSRAKFARYEAQIAEYKEKLQMTKAEADKRQDAAKERIHQLQESLDQQKSGREATEKAEGDLKTAREHIERRMATIRSNSSELQMYRDRARAQRQAGP